MDRETRMMALEAWDRWETLVSGHRYFEHGVMDEDVILLYRLMVAAHEGRLNEDKTPGYPSGG